jgi:hypothetical protein
MPLHFLDKMRAKQKAIPESGAKCRSHFLDKMRAKARALSTRAG